MLACLQERQVLMCTVYTHGKDIDMDVVNEKKFLNKLDGSGYVN